MFGYVLNANWIMEEQHKATIFEVANIHAIYDQDKNTLFYNINKKVQRVMDIYGTRLTLAEKAIRKYREIVKLEELTGPRKKKG